MVLRIRSVPLDPASEAFYDAYASRVYALALRITGDRDVAAEVVEEVFVGIGNGTLVHDRGSVESWLIRTARDIALEHRESQTATAAVHSTEATPRALVEGAFFGGLTVPELARTFSLTEEEVRQRLRSGMAELRAQFAGTAIR
jgi:RNA polymerase sigma-70 factor (ECF subfamily)